MDGYRAQIDRLVADAERLAEQCGALKAEGDSAYAWAVENEREIGSLRRQLAGAVEALREIAARPTVERNPDGDDQAAHTMQLIAREALERY